MSKTMKVTEFNRPRVREFRSKLDSELKKIGTKYGVKFELGAIRFDVTKFQTKMTVKVNSKTADKKEKENFKSQVSLYHPELNASKVCNGKFTEGRSSYTVVGYNTRSRKYPFQCVRDDGARFSFTTATMKRYFGK